MDDIMNIQEFIQLDVLQNIQDQFTKATGMASVIVDYKGRPITKKAGFSNFCKKLRENDNLKKKCHQCDAHGGLQSAIKGTPHIYICHMGLVDFAVPIIVNEKYLGAMLVGQINLPDNEKGKLTRLVNSEKKLIEDEELINYYNQIEVIPYERIKASADLIFHVINQLAEKEYIFNVRQELNKNELKLVEEENRRIKLEKNLKDAELKALHSQMNPHFLFNVLNTIGRLAFLEDAKDTEKIVYAFSDMLRYTLKRSNINAAKIGEEIEYSVNYLAIQKMRLGDKLKFDLQVDKDLIDTLCPFMIVQPMVENCIKYVVENKREGGKISIIVRKVGAYVFIEVKDNGQGISKSRAKEILEGKARTEENCIGIFNVDRRLKFFFGENNGIKILNNENSQGTTIRFQIPIDTDLEVFE